MASLAPPSINRHRASSTNVRPALTLSSLGRRRSNSELPPLAGSPCHTPPAMDSPTTPRELPPLSLDIPQSSKFAAFQKASLIELFSRVMDFLHVAHKESPFISTPSSPRHSRSSTSTEDSVLPLTSPAVATFSEAYPEKLSQKGSWWQGSPSVCVVYLPAHLVTQSMYSLGSHSSILCDRHVSVVNCACIILHVDASHHYGMASKSHGSRAVGPRASRVFPKRSGSYYACGRGPFGRSRVESRLVNTRQCALGMFIRSSRRIITNAYIHRMYLRVPCSHHYTQPYY